MSSSSKKSISSKSKSSRRERDRRKAAANKTFREGELRGLFKKYDKDNSGDIEINELRPLLLSKNFHFNNENLKMLISKFDPDNKGTLKYKDFKSFVLYINEMFVAFRGVDKNGSGKISSVELKDAFTVMGFSFSKKVVEWIVQCFDEDGNGRLDLQEFINLTCFLNNLREEFAEKDKDGSGTLDAKELRPLIKKMKLKDTASSVLKKYDQDGSGEIGFEEFVHLLFDLKFNKGKSVEYGAGKHIEF